MDFVIRTVPLILPFCFLPFSKALSLAVVIMLFKKYLVAWYYNVNPLDAMDNQAFSSNDHSPCNIMSVSHYFSPVEKIDLL